MFDRRPPPTRRVPGLPAALAIALAAVLAAGDALAALDARASVTARRLPIGSPTPILLFQDSVQNLDGSGDFAAIDLTPALPYLSATGGARVRYGVISAFAHADANHPGDGLYYSNSSGFGQFTDQFRVAAPGVTGSGTMTLHATAHAVFDYDPQGSTDTTDFVGSSAAWIDLVINNVTRIADRYSTAYTADISENLLARLKVDVRSLNGDYTLTRPDNALAGASYVVTQQFAIDMPFNFGSLINVSAKLTLPADANACCSPGDGLDTDVTAWFRWDGISGVTRGDGTPVGDFQALGVVTGFDYAQAAVVPEPGHGLMMLAGLLPLWALRRRWNRHTTETDPASPRRSSL